MTNKVYFEDLDEKTREKHIERPPEVRSAAIPLQIPPPL